jgi:hypothetical protein
MASKRRQRRNECGDKVRHSSPQAAWGHAHSLRQKEQFGRVGIYKCRFCRAWHVGHHS